MGISVRHSGTQETAFDWIIPRLCFRGYERLFAESHRFADFEIFRWFYVSSRLMTVFPTVP